MKQNLLLKRLSASDLTIFEHQFRNTQGSKQKAINLDKAVFLDELYPNLRNRLATGNESLPVQLHIYGPGRAGLHSQLRKILLQAKNIRLNGEFIRNPIEEEGRYDSLEKDDLVLMELVGNDAPSIAKMFFISKKSEEDEGLFRAFMSAFGKEFSGRKALIVLREAELPAIIEPLTLPDDHPVLDFIDREALEDAVQGGIEGVRKLQHRRRTRGISHDELQRAKRNAERNGRLGEELLNAWLEDQVGAGHFGDYLWVADNDAVAPYDFKILDKDGSVLRVIDAKSTSGDFKNRIHISYAELFEMVRGQIPYDLYRLYNIGDILGSFRVAENVGPHLKSALELLESLPTGIRSDGISIDPSILPFDIERVIDLSEPEDS